MMGTIGIINGYHASLNKVQLWKELLEMKANSIFPLLLMGDFNEVRISEEKKGCTNVTSNMADFDMWINDMSC